MRLEPGTRVRAKGGPLSKEDHLEPLPDSAEYKSQGGLDADLLGIREEELRLTQERLTVALEAAHHSENEALKLMRRVEQLEEGIQCWVESGRLEELLSVRYAASMDPNEQDVFYFGVLEARRATERAAKALADLLEGST